MCEMDKGLAVATQPAFTGMETENSAFAAPIKVAVTLSVWRVAMGVAETRVAVRARRDVIVRETMMAFSLVLNVLVMFVK